VRDGETRIVFAPDAPGLHVLFVDRSGGGLCGTMRSDPGSTDGRRTAGEWYRSVLDGVDAERYGDVARPNGIGVSPAGAILYHSDTTRGVWAHDYDDGSVSGRRMFVSGDVVSPDGLAVDEAGNVWIADVSGTGAVRAFDPHGTEVGRVEVPAEMVTSVCFGGPDRRDLYVVTADNTQIADRRGTIYRTRVDTAGCTVPAARV
jgi:sugar lactone lactonase YvrE